MEAGQKLKIKSYYLGRVGRIPACNPRTQKAEAKGP